jgi:pimeloyl-ACP methyl ester carboxylesterase
MLTEVRRDTATGTLSALSRPGTGTPIVLLHGAMADAPAWRNVAAALPSDRPLLLPNRRGRAPSAPLGDDYGIDREVEDLMGWLDTLPGPVDVAAHSYGGLIATEAVRRGADVRSLVLYEPVARPFGGPALPALSEAVGRGDLDRAVEIINVDVSGYSWEHVETLRNSRAWGRLRELAAPSAAELGAINGFDLEPDAYRSLGIPVMLVAGELSRHRPPYGPSVEVFREALGLDDVVLLGDQDHLAHITAPEALAGVIEDALPD